MKRFLCTVLVCFLVLYAGQARAQIVSGTTTNGSVTAGGSAVYTFSGTSGQFANLNIYSASYTGNITVKNPDGTAWFGSGLSRAYGSLAQTGTFTVTITAQYPSQHGAFSLYFVLGGGSVSGGSLTSGGTIPDTLPLNGLMSYQFTGTAGQGIMLHVGASYTMDVVVFKPDGSYWSLWEQSGERHAALERDRFQRQRCSDCAGRDIGHGRREAGFHRFHQRRPGGRAGAIGCASRTAGDHCHQSCGKQRLLWHNRQLHRARAAGAFLLYCRGTQYVAALFPDGITYVLPAGAVPGINSQRAEAGDTIMLYGVGFGPVTPDISAGQIVQQSNTLANSFQVSFGGQPAKVSYSGLAPTYVGLYQINVVVPDVAASDMVPVTFKLGGAEGTQTLYIAVGN